MRCAHVLLVFVSCFGFSTAQEPKPKPVPPDKADKAPAKADKDKPDKNEPVPGYRTKKIEGVTFLISEEVLNVDASGYERKPLEVLAYQVRLMNKALPPKALELLRKLTIWVEWEEKKPANNGRQAMSYGTYFNAPPQKLAAEGRHPLQSKTIVIHLLRYLTERCQPKNERETECHLLHEFSHAVHDQLIGYDHAGIMAAYQQAMERKLYERDFYASTNHREFFAELSCSYLDRLPYYPHNRDDLRKHDPVTFKVLESVWGKPAVAEAARGPMPHSAKANMDVSLAAHVMFGPTLTGPEPVAGQLEGKVVLIGFWGGPYTNVLNRLTALHDDLADYGLVVIAPAWVKHDASALKAEAQKREVPFAVLEAGRVRETEAPVFSTPPGGHALLFDSAGKCVYRGSAYDVGDATRAAVGKMLLAAALGPDAPPKALGPVADALAAGAGPVAVLAKLTPLTNSSDADTKARAKKLHDLILAPGEKALADARASAKTDPLGAFLAAERVAARFKNTPLATRANTLMTNVRSDKSVAAELKARLLTTDLEKLAGKLRGQEGNFNPGDPMFQEKNQQTFAQMKALLEQLRKQYSGARATAAAEKIAREFAVP
jgi:hypothetical protein